MRRSPCRPCFRTGLHRQILYGGLRIGLYEPVKRMFMGGDPDKVGLLHSFAARGDIAKFEQSCSCVHLLPDVPDIEWSPECWQVAPLPIKIAAGMTTGAVAIMVASPTDLVKVRPHFHLELERRQSAS